MFACTTVDGEGHKRDLDEQFLTMFQKLYRFIQGNNAEEVLMKMTVPVFTFSHLNTENMVDKVTMCFCINQINQVEMEPPFPPTHPPKNPTNYSSTYQDRG